MGKNAFIDKNGVLTCWGYVESNGDDTKIPVPDNFFLDAGKWQYDGKEFVAYSPAPVTDTTKVAKDALQLLDPKTATVEDVLSLLKVILK